MKVALNQRAVEVLEARYLLRDLHQGQIIETPEQLFERVAKSVSQAEKKFGGKKQRDFWFSRFLKSLVELEFLPNSPTLMNAGTPMGQLSACFVIPIEDNLGQIFDSLKLAALVQQSGGGTGFSFSRLRKKAIPSRYQPESPAAQFLSCGFLMQLPKIFAREESEEGQIWES